MSSSIAKPETKSEALRQMLEVDRSLANTISRRLEIEERRKELSRELRGTKIYQEMKSLAKEDRELVIEQHEKNGARKMMFALMKRFGMSVPETKLTKLTQRNETARALVEAGA